jgi:phosphomannomutase/phosphoglucomutase
MLKDKEIFRRYDIRGIYGKNLTDDVARKVALVFAGQVMQEVNNPSPTISVGRDIRFSSDKLFNSLKDSLLSVGVKVIDLGVCPSPLTYFNMYTENTDAYMMITGSHNPPEFNGIKFGTKNTVYHSEKIENIYNDIVNKNFPPEKEGSLEKFDVIPSYLNYMKEHFKELKNAISSLEKDITVVIDAGSGTAGNIAPIIFRELGVKVIELYCEPDGNFPGHHPDPTVESNMKEAKGLLLNNNADFCAGFDGDSDRLGILDSNGEMVWGDELIGIFAADIAEKYQGHKVVADVKASQGLYEYIEKLGMKSVMYFSGHSMIKEKMKVENAVVGGEMSSHFFFADKYFSYDDGIYAALRYLQAYVNGLIKGTIKCSADLTKDIPKYINTPEIREFFPDEKKFQTVESLKEIFNEYLNTGRFGVKDIVDIDGIRVIFENGWALVRASNTEPLLVTRFEAKTEADFEQIKKIIMDEIKKFQ